MKMFSWLLLLVATFLVALALALTFIQPEFKEVVKIKLLFFPDREIPMYLFILCTFTAGLGFGCATALVVYVKAQLAAMKKAKKIRELEDELARLKPTAAPQADVPVPGTSPGTPRS